MDCLSWGLFTVTGTPRVCRCGLFNILFLQTTQEINRTFALAPSWCSGAVTLEIQNKCVRLFGSFGLEKHLKMSNEEIFSPFVINLGNGISLSVHRAPPPRRDHARFSDWNSISRIGFGFLAAAHLACLSSRHDGQVEASVVRGGREGSALLLYKSVVSARLCVLLASLARGWRGDVLRDLSLTRMRTHACEW